MTLEEMKAELEKQVEDLKRLLGTTDEELNVLRQRKKKTKQELYEAERALRALAPRKRRTKKEVPSD